MSKKSGSGNIGQTIYASGLRNGVFTGVGVRPANLGFPNGLSGEPPVLSPMDYLVVAGGGGGGTHNDGRFPAGGGGGGGYRIGSGYTLTQAQTWTIIVGAGGSANPTGSSPSYGFGGSPGSNSGMYIGITTIQSTGGGGGGGPSQGGFAGGSGGGGGNNGAPGGAGNLGGYTPSEGNNGGNSVGQYDAGGGGGAGGTGGTPTTGGLGSNNTISGSSVYYSYGGWGAQTPGFAGNTNTGGAGTGGANAPAVGRNGGSGVIIIRYAAPQIATGGTITNVTGNVIHTFTGDGFFNVVTAGYSIN
jgi:hypothetical protein